MVQIRSLCDCCGLSMQGVRGKPLVRVSIRITKAFPKLRNFKKIFLENDKKFNKLGPEFKKSKYCAVLYLFNYLFH